jgi:hypothetical protein
MFMACLASEVVTCRTTVLATPWTSSLSTSSFFRAVFQTAGSPMGETS